MSRQTVDIVRGLMDAYSRGDLQIVFACFDPEVEFRPPAKVPDFEVCHGLEEMVHNIRRWTSTWESLRLDGLEYLDAGDRVFVSYRQHGKVKATDVEVHNEVFDVFTLRAGKVIRYEKFFKRGPALEAAGLTEDALS